MDRKTIATDEWRPCLYTEIHFLMKVNLTFHYKSENFRRIATKRGREQKSNTIHLARIFVLLQHDWKQLWLTRIEYIVAASQ